jgi:exosortase B
MSTVSPSLPPAEAAASRLWPMAGDRWASAFVALGFLALYLPTLWDASQGRWAAETQGHELLVLAIAGWLLFRKRDALAALPAARPAWGAGALLGFGLLLYVFGRTQGVLRVELLSLIVLVAGVLVCFKGWPAVRLAWFALFFMLFAIPLPYALALALTAPMKTAVSVVAAQLLAALGYPIGRSGVVITIGQYQLLVTEACAGLQTMFTLEAMGLLYAGLVNHPSTLRNVLLSALVVPIAFSANVVRVAVLALVTYYLGDAAGQGFLHGFAGMVLFVVALVLIMGTDHLLGRALTPRRVAP